MGQDVLPSRGGMEILPMPPTVLSETLETIPGPPESQAECVRKITHLTCTRTSLTGELPHEETAEIAPDVKEDAL